MSWLNEWYRGTVTEDADGRYRGAGLGAALMKPFVDEEKIERNAQQSAVKRTIVAAGEDPSEYNLGPNATTADAQGAVTRTVRERIADTKDKDRTNALTDQLKILTQTQAPGLEESRATNTRLIQQGNQQFQLAQQQGNQQMQLALMQMQDNADQRVAELEYQKSRDRKEDMQYNERMEELDRKDRRAMMQNMAMGLASLGAAFAL